MNRLIPTDRHADHPVVGRGSRRIVLLVVADVAVTSEKLDLLTKKNFPDVIVSLGDLDDLYLNGLAGRFKGLPMIGVRGNHDSRLPLPAPFKDLHGATLEVAGRKFGGLAGCCRYKPEGDFQYTQQEAAALIAPMDRVDVFLSHNSPAGVHEPALPTPSRWSWWKRTPSVPAHHAGFTALHGYCTAHLPPLLIHGHQHVNRSTLLDCGTLITGVYGAETVIVENSLCARNQGTNPALFTASLSGPDR